MSKHLIAEPKPAPEVHTDPYPVEAGMYWHRLLVGTWILLWLDRSPRGFYARNPYTRVVVQGWHDGDEPRPGQRWVKVEPPKE